MSPVRVIRLLHGRLPRKRGGLTGMDTNGYELWCSARLSGSCYTTGTCRFPFVRNLVISHYRGKEVVNTSNGAKSNGIHKCLLGCANISLHR
jgi:hypothetical protein